MTEGAPRVGPSIGAVTPACRRHGVCAARGFSAGTAAAGIRDGDPGREDIAVVVSDRPCAGAGVFTRNLVKAAPVVISQLTLRRGTPIHAVVANAGNANACTGAQGLRDALRMCALTAGALGRDPVEVLVCSTGVIGRALPMERVSEGLRAAAGALSGDAGAAAARAIMTTDTLPKTASAVFIVDGVEHRVGGMAKGAGMIHPDMATLLALVTTDADVAAPDLQALLGEVAASSFNSITVDGDTSTNDTLFALANGAAGGPSLRPGTAVSRPSARRSWVSASRSRSRSSPTPRAPPSTSGSPSPEVATTPRRASPPAPWRSRRWSRRRCTGRTPTGDGSSWPWGGAVPTSAWTG